MNGKLKLALLTRGKPQYEVADELGMSETKLSRIVHGRLEPTATEMRDIAVLFGVHPDDLFSNDPPPVVPVVLEAGGPPADLEEKARRYDCLEKMARGRSGAGRITSVHHAFKSNGWLDG